MTFWQYTSDNSTQTKSECGLTKQAMSPIVSSIVWLIFFLLFSLLDVNSSLNLYSKSFWADINLGKDIDSFSNNINYNKPKHHSIYFSNLVVERERE